MRILIVGAGAVGGYFGAHLTQSGADVTFFVRPARAASLAEAGLVVVDPAGTRNITRVATVTADTPETGWDLVLLAVKATTLSSAIDDIAPAIGVETLILPILNGIDHIQTLTDRFGTRRVLGGVAVVATELSDNGDIIQVAPGASLSFGELDGAESARARQIADVFALAEFDSTLSHTIVQDMWEKWLFMAAGGASTVLLGGPIGRVVAVPDGRSTIALIIDEVAQVHRAAGFSPRGRALERVTSILTQPGSGFTTSMFRDFAAGRRTEVEPILGALVQRAITNGIPTPLLDAATVRLRVFESVTSW